MVIPREQRYSTKNGSGLDSLGHFLAFLLLFASSRCCFRRVDFVTAPFYSLQFNFNKILRWLNFEVNPIQFNLWMSFPPLTILHQQVL